MYFFFLLFLCLFVCFPYSGLLVFILFYLNFLFSSLDTCLYSSEKEQERMQIWVSGEQLGGKGGEGP